jgi:hypothetical protein
MAATSIVSCYMAWRVYYIYSFGSLAEIACELLACWSWQWLAHTYWQWYAMLFTHTMVYVHFCCFSFWYILKIINYFCEQATPLYNSLIQPYYTITLVCSIGLIHVHYISTLHQTCILITITYKTKQHSHAHPLSMAAIKILPVFLQCMHYQIMYTYVWWLAANACLLSKLC